MKGSSDSSVQILHTKILTLNVHKNNVKIHMIIQQKVDKVY